MKLSDQLAFQSKIIEQSIPGTVNEIQQIIAHAAETNDEKFIDLTNTLNRKLSVFVGIGMMAAYLDVMNAMRDCVLYAENILGED
jgi:hypothetical protein